MAKKKRGKSKPSSPRSKRSSGSSGEGRPDFEFSRRDPRSLFSRSVDDGGDTTGRFLVTTVDEQPETMRTLLRELEDRAGIKRMAIPRGTEMVQAGDAEGVVLDDFGIVIVDGDPDQMRAARGLQQDRSADYYHVEPEHYCYTAAEADELLPEISAGRSTEYWQGYRAAVEQLQQRYPMIDEPSPQPFGAPGEGPLSGQIPFALPRSVRGPEALRQATWGLRITRATQTPFTGNGVRVAVLDTGIDLHHPDVQGRVAGSASFVAGSSVQDRHGHGTHCAGTLCGRTDTAMRYGVAPAAELYVGKVLNDRGEGREGDVIQGIRWALAHQCRVVSASIQRGVSRCSYLQAYHAAGLRVLQSGGLVIAAAGNHSNRSAGVYRAVASPANTPSIVGVGAIDDEGHLGNFSNRKFCKWGEVDFVGPGVGVYSSDITPSGYHYRNGTSMATPHVAGIAALLLEQDPGQSGFDLYERLRGLALPAEGGSVDDFGHGLARAPV